MCVCVSRPWSVDYGSEIPDSTVSSGYVRVMCVYECMCVYVCMYVYIYIYIYIYIYVHIHCMYMCMYAHMTLDSSTCLDLYPRPTL